MTDLSDCPHRPGTPEWKRWQAEWVRAESQRRAEAGEYGATAEDKAAAGLPATETIVRRYRCGRRLCDYPEPWRSEIERRMFEFVPRKAAPLQCPWCMKQFKQAGWFSRHTATGTCHGMNPRHPHFREGLYEAWVNPQGKIVGYCATAKAYAEWGEADPEEAASVQQREYDGFMRAMA